MNRREEFVTIRRGARDVLRICRPHQQARERARARAGRMMTPDPITNLDGEQAELVLWASGRVEARGWRPEDEAVLVAHLAALQAVAAALRDEGVTLDLDAVMA